MIFSVHVCVRSRSKSKIDSTKIDLRSDQVKNYTDWYTVDYSLLCYLHSTSGKSSEARLPKGAVNLTGGLFFPCMHD